MVEVFALKNEHTVYELLRQALAGIEVEANIVGLDDPTGGLHIPWYHNTELLYEKPFFFYIEEYDTFKGRNHADHYHFYTHPEYSLYGETVAPPYPPILRHPNFKGFISHIQDTCDRLYDEFTVPVFHLPLCSSLQGWNSPEDIKERIDSLDDRPVHLIAWSSWNDQRDNNFINRGGILVDKLVCDLFDLGCDIRFSMRTLNPMECKVKRDQHVEIYRNYLGEQEKDALFSEGDIFLLPSDQVHSASLTYAMSFGMPCVVSEGWGIREFCNSLNSIPIVDLIERYKNDPLAKARLNDDIVNLCNNKELLKLKRRNTFAYYMANHSRTNYKNSIREILFVGLNS